MIRFLFLILLFSFLTTNCKDKKNLKHDNRVISLNSYNNALDVPLEKTGVVIQVDTVTFFGKDNLTVNESSKKVIQSITSINDEFNFEDIITKKISTILNNRDINYTIIPDFNTAELPKDLITKHNVNQVNFNSIKEKYPYDDLIVINVKNGFDYKHDDPKNSDQFAAKTFLALNILDLNNKKIKFAENIGGVRFLDNSLDSVNQKHLEYIMGKSINETIEIIEKKY